MMTESMPPKPFEVLGVELQWKLRRHETMNQYCVLSATVPPGVGIPPHKHPDQEAFYVLEGLPEFAEDGPDGLVWKQAAPGEMVNIRPEAMHGFRNATDKNVKVLITCEAGLGRFFEAAGTPLNAGAPRPEITPDAIGRVLAIAEKYGQRFAAPA
jgi:quercetin dioxygenase-like cupin family protein